VFQLAPTDLPKRVNCVPQMTLAVEPILNAFGSQGLCAPWADREPWSPPMGSLSSASGEHTMWLPVTLRASS